MALTSILAIYFILWWVVLFAVLPWGNQSAHEAGEETAPGHAASAPLKPQIGRKFLITTVLSAAIFAVGYGVAASGLFTLDDIPFLPVFEYQN
ncbi:MAG: DUF1467 family protein [Aestuariivirgaceae bacterium]